MITNIRIDKLFSHPDNPRKDLGDLTELAASIKATGILQNLTVVPRIGNITKEHIEGTYIVVIGHRRKAAAKLAGLTELPCVIADMDPKTQVATMLLENMQRNDLTIWEQAQGFQMMLDFGETVEQVAELTGFSKGTIRSRVKLLELDKDKFQKSVTRGATLQDYAELDKIQDIKLKNKALEFIGTQNFQWTLRQAIDEENKEKIKVALIKELETFATRVQKADGLSRVQWYGLYSESKVTKPADAGEKKYFFIVSTHNIELYRESSGDAPRSGAGPSPEEQLRQERRAKLDALNKRAYELRQAFVADYAGRQKDARAIMEMALRAIMTGDSYYNLAADVCTALGIEIPEPKDEDDCDDDDVMAEAAVLEAFEASPDKVLLAAAYCSLDDEGARYHDWQGRFDPSPTLDALYDALEQLGYEISEEERALRDGSHELYVRGDA